MTEAAARQAQQETPQGALERAKDLCDGWRTFATRLRAAAEEQGQPRTLSFQACHKWREKGVPPFWAKLIEEITGGKVTRQDLRPDLFG